MITVIAQITVAAQRRAEFLTAFAGYAEEVRHEKGCLEYQPMIDLDARLPLQLVDDRVVTVVEKWQSVEDLAAHLSSSALQTFQEKVQGLVEGLSLKVLQKA